MMMKKTAAFAAALTICFSSGIIPEYVKAESLTEVSAEEVVKGDCNCDGTVNAADLIAMKSYLIGDSELKSSQNSDMNDDGQINVIDLCLLKNKFTGADKSEPETGNPSVDAFIPVADFLFSELDKGTFKPGDIISSEDFRNTAGEDSELYRNSHTSYEYKEDLKPSEAFNFDYLLKVISKDDPLYEYLEAPEKLDELLETDSDRYHELMDRAEPETDDIKPEDLFSPAGLESYRAFFEPYNFVFAFFPDKDTVIIDNGTGFLLSVSGLLITRNGMSAEMSRINVPDKLGFDGNIIYVYEKADGYDNVYKWYAGT